MVKAKTKTKWLEKRGGERMKTNDGEVGKEGGSGGSRQSSKKWALGVGERWQTRGGGGEGGWRGLVSGGEVKKKKRKKK